MSPYIVIKSKIKYDQFSYNIDHFLNKSIVWYSSILILLSVQIILAATHQPWRDEWQALQISLQSPTISALFENLRYEGHPPLWYFILRSTAIFIPEIYVLSSVQIFISVLTQIIIQAFSPFSRFERLLIGSSVFVLFEYGAISRSLSLGVLLIVTFSAFRHKKSSWLALAALPMVDFIFGLISIALIATIWQDRRLWWPGIAIWLVCSLFSAWSVRPAPDMVTAALLNAPLTELLLFLSRLSALLIPLQMNGLNFEWDNPFANQISPIIGALFLIFSYYNLRCNTLNSIIFLIISASICLFSLFVYPFQIRHLELLAILLIVFKWYDLQNGYKLSINFKLWLYLISFLGCIVSIINVVQPFDVSNQVAQFIADKNLRNRHWLAFPAPRATGVSALLDMEFHTLEGNCTQSFTRWNQPSSIQTNIELREHLNSISKQYGRVYLLTNFHLLKTTYGHIVTQLAAFPPGYNGESYYIYVVAPDLPESSRRPPKCEPKDRLPLISWISHTPISHL